MKNTQIIVWSLALLAATIVSCKDQSQASCSDPVDFVYDTPFELCAGNTGYWSENDELSVTFKEVVEDSRCPVDAVCVWAGSVDIALSFNNFDQAFTDTLGIGSMKHPLEVEFAGRTFRLLSVSPENYEGQTIPPDAYKATLVVED